MKHLLILLMLSVSLQAFSQNDKLPPRKTRAQSSFGLHFDFHATANDKEIGKTLSYAMIDSLLTVVKPDFIQVDCKGHAGYSSYPTKVGYKAGGFTQDVLKLFREVTAKHGVALYVHYSGVWDAKAIEEHPHWAAIDANGKSHEMEISRHSAYLDSLMIPQLKEIADYGIDGAWVDGENWAIRRDYSQKAVAGFKAETGLDVPLKPEDQGWYEFSKYNREMFKVYMRKYVDAMHQYKPGFQITSNWAYTGYMPEPVDANIDFISGDVASNSSVYSAAFESRCIAPQDKPWDLMSWGFSYNFGNQFGSPKNPQALMQEAAQVISTGGGFQVYYTQNRDASLKPWQFNGMAQIADFCRQRQPFCKDAKPLPQVAVLYSTYAFYKFAKVLYDYNPDGIVHEVKGVTMSLLDKQFSVQVLQEHHLKGRMAQFPLIVVPGWEQLEPAFKEELLAYVRNGGNLLVTGTNAVECFKSEGQLTSLTLKPESYLNLGFNGRIGNLKSPSVEATLPENATPFGNLHKNEDFRSASVPASALIPYGKGKIAFVFANLGASYMWQRTQTGADFLAGLANQLIVPAVRIEGSSYVHVNLTTKGKQTFIHLINVSGHHDNEKIYEWAEVSPLHNITVNFKTAKTPAKVILQPGESELQFKHRNGEVSVKVPKIDVYSILMVE